MTFVPCTQGGVVWSVLHYKVLPKLLKQIRIFVQCTGCDQCCISQSTPKTIKTQTQWHTQDTKHNMNYTALNTKQRTRHYFNAVLRSRTYLLNKYLLQSVWRMRGWRKTSNETYFLWYRYYCSTVLSGNIGQELELEPI